MVKLKVDLTKWQGYGNCVSAAPDVYDVDDDGKVAAVRSCPVSALSVES